MKSIIFLLSIISVTSFAQVDFNHYKTLKCHGELPLIFTASLESQVEEHEKNY